MICIKSSPNYSKQENDFLLSTIRAELGGCCFRNLTASLCLCLAVLTYENVVEMSSETDEDDRTLLSEENGLTNGEEGGSPAGASVPNLEASPRVGHALLSYRGGAEGSEGRDGRQSHHHACRLGDNQHRHLNGTGE